MPRSRSPEYPAIGLQEAIERVRQVYESGIYQRPVSKEVFAQRMGYKSLSGASLPVLSALSKYGLIEGRGNDTRISQLGVSVITHAPGSPEWVGAIRAAAARPELFADLDRRDPSGKATAAIKTYLLNRGFIPPAAEAAIRSYRETKALVESESSCHYHDDRDQDSADFDAPRIEVGDLIQVEIGGALQLSEAARVRAVQEHEGRQWVFIEGSEAGIPVEQAILEQKRSADYAGRTAPRLAEEKLAPGARREVFTLDEGDVVLTYPAEISAASYDDLASFFELFLRKAKRRAVAYDLTIKLSGSSGKTIRSFVTSKEEAIKRGVEALDNGHDVVSVEASDPLAPPVTPEMIKEKYNEL